MTVKRRPQRAFITKVARIKTAELGRNISSNHMGFMMDKAQRIILSRHLPRSQWYHHLNFQEQHLRNQKPLLPQLLILNTNIRKVPTSIMQVSKRVKRRKLIHQRRHICTKGMSSMPLALLMTNTIMRMQEEKIRLFLRFIVMIPSTNSQIKKSKSSIIIVRKSTSE